MGDNIEVRDSIYIVDPSTKQTVEVKPTSFSSLAVKERADLQEWLIRNPSVLGEELLLVTSEFNKFDKTDKRLDLLLLDKNAIIVVAELKLDVSGTLADQQAIRYAAFCSTMTMEDVVDLFCKRGGYDRDQGVNHMCTFLGSEELPTLSSEPRIMLVAGSFVDQELTATVLWLRKFNLDISCIELTPYQHPADPSNVLLVPRIIIPLAEASEYQIKLERKERSESVANTRNKFQKTHARILQTFKSFGKEISGPPNPSTQDYMSVSIGNGEIHYEWLIRRKTKLVDVAIHFESRNYELNTQRLSYLLERMRPLVEFSQFESETGSWGRENQWAHVCIHVPYQGSEPTDEEADLAAEVMSDLMDESLHILRSLPI